jgi:diaminopimelate decarboxylase
MDPLSHLVQRLFASPNGELAIGGVAVSELAGRYGTPLFVYDRGVIEKKWELLRETLPSEFAIFYSVKANPNRTILRCLLEKGCGLEIASGGEFVQALDAGCSPERILFAGPGKTESELDLVLAGGIAEIHVESVREACRVASIAQSRGLRAGVALRVNPDGEAEGGAMRMGGRPSPFGVDEEQLDETLDRIFDLGSLDFRGIHLFAGTQILDPETLLNQYRKGLDIARRVAVRLGKPLRRVDFGGGLGIPYFPHEHELDMCKLQESLNTLLSSVRVQEAFAGTEFVVEPGRYLVGEAGVYVARINDIKISRGKKFLILDGGMNHHLAASGNLGQTIKRNYPIAVLNKLDQPATEVVDVVGPLCTPLDCLGRGVNLPRSGVGDLVGVFQSGAYARSASPLGFLSHPAPPEVWVERGQHRLIRRRGELTDYSRDQLIDKRSCDTSL